MTAIFYEFVKSGAVFYLPGAPFLVSALMIAISIALVASVLRRTRERS